MVKTGLIDNLLSILDDNRVTFEKHEESVSAKKLSDSDNALKSFCLEVGKSKDIESILLCERMILRHEKTHYAKDNAGATNSLNMAIQKFEEGYEAYKLVLDKNIYLDTTKSYLTSDKEKGLPVDGFIKSVRSHKTRLFNRSNTVGISNEHRSLLLARVDNMRTLESEYKKLQAIALEIKLPEKSKEHER